MSPHRRISYLLGCCALVVMAITLTACGSSSPSTSSSSKPPSSAAASPSPSSNSAAVAEITTNWETFFSAKTPLSQRISLLQDGPQLQSAVQGLLGSSFASAASAKVTNVTVTSPTQASVTYDILVGGTPELTNQKGTAVYEDGVWKVGVSSFCSLASLANGGKTTGLPAACQSS